MKCILFRQKKRSCSGRGRLLGPHLSDLLADDLVPQKKKMPEISFLTLEHEESFAKARDVD